MSNLIKTQATIDMIERYSTWSQTYSNMVEDAISRKAAVDVIHKYFAERIEQSPTHMTEDGEVYDLGICNPLLADNKALSQAIKELPSAQSDLIATIQNGIKATDADDVYSCGMRNGMRWCKSLIDGKEPLYENCPSAPPTEASCWGCNCQKMERLKEQKTFSEMVHLHDAETHEERTETHGVCLDTISRQMAIDAFKKELTVGESKGNYVTLCSAVSYEGAKQILESLPPAQPEPQWIPCSERLPEDDDYRPCYGYDDGAVWWINDIGQMGLGWYYTSTKTWAYYDEISASEKHVGNVVAWMPLPEPYKEKDNERA